MHIQSHKVIVLATVISPGPGNTSPVVKVAPKEVVLGMVHLTACEMVQWMVPLTVHKTVQQIVPLTVHKMV